MNLCEFHVNLGDFLLKFGNFGNSYEFGTNFVRIWYEFRTNLEILVKFAESARDIHTNFVRICQIRTNFVRISYKFVRNWYKNSYEFLKFRPKGAGTEFPDFCWAPFGPDGSVWDGTFIESWGLKMKLDFCPL